MFSFSFLKLHAFIYEQKAMSQKKNKLSEAIMCYLNTRTLNMAFQTVTLSFMVFFI